VTLELPRLAAAYVQATNDHNSAGFLNLFADDAQVNDAGRQFNGRGAIQEWSEREVFGANVTLDVLEAVVRDRETILKTVVDGTFDRTGLPDPVIIHQRLRSRDGRIASLACWLDGTQPPN